MIAYHKSNCLPGYSIQRISAEPTIGSVPAAYTTPTGHVCFSSKQNLPKSSRHESSPQKLGFFKSIANRIASLILWLIPKRVYSWIEARTLYLGSRIPQLKVTLDEMKSKNLPQDKKDLLKSIEEVRFQSSKEINNYGWYQPAKPGKPTFLLSMGNAWSIADMLNYSELMKEGYGLLAYEYPGYGSTKGKPSEKALSQSLEAASDFLQKQKNIPINDQIAYGISLGGAVACSVAKKRPFKALILESTMTSFPDVTKSKVEQVMPTWLLPLHNHVQSKFDSLSSIEKITCPLLIMHGTNDSVLPQDCAKALYENAGTPEHKKMLKLYKVDNHCMEPSMTINGINEFLRENEMQAA